MSWVTIIWSAIASACITLAGIYLLVWCRNRTACVNLLFSLTAVAAAGFAFCELSMMLAETPRGFGTALRWGQVSIWLWSVSLVGFVWLYLQAGRPWLAWATCGLRTFALLPNFLVGQNLNYREITTLKHIPFLGESISVAKGVPNPWMVLGQLSLVLLVIFVGDASLTAWRRGHRRKALMVGGSVVFLVLVGLVESVLIFWRKVQAPLTVSPFYLCLVLVMAYELGRDVLRASQLVGELQASDAGLRENEERMSLAVDAANFGIWIRDLARNEIWASDKWRELFGFTPSERIELERIFQRLHPDDREAFQGVFAKALGGRS